MFESKSDFDPASLDDPVAQKAAWTPLKQGGASFTTRVLKEISPHRLEFKTSIGYRVFCFVFMIAGLAPIWITINSSIQGKDENVQLMLPIIGILFFTVGVVLLYTGTTPVVFDKQQNSFWRNRKSPREVFNRLENKSMIPLSDIYAVQVIEEYVSGDDSYYSYEINLIRKNGERFNVVDHGGKERILNDAHKLSGFLGVPLWNGID